MGKDIYKSFIWQAINIQMYKQLTTQQKQKYKQPNLKMGRGPLTKKEVQLTNRHIKIFKITNC